MKIANRQINSDNPPYVIAEIGSNHNCNIETAKALIDVAADAGCNAVKFQIFTGRDIASGRVTADRYGSDDWNKGFNAWVEVLDSISPGYEWYAPLFEYAHRTGLHVIATPESREALDFLRGQNIDAYKVASMDLNYTQLLSVLGEVDSPVLLSSGMSTLAEIDTALDLLDAERHGNRGLLVCVSNYPAQPSDVNIRQITDFKDRYPGVTIGLSDHSEENHVISVAAYLGAEIIEKHMTLDKTMFGPDHAFALEPMGVTDMVAASRTGWELRNYSRGETERCDFDKRQEFRRSLHFVRSMDIGETVTVDDIKMVRPGTGLEPSELDRIIGKRLMRTVTEDDMVSIKDVR